jgi:hypothetical protein
MGGSPFSGRGWFPCGPAGEQALEQAGPAQARIAAVPGAAVPGGVALADQVVAVLADGVELQ